MYGDNRDRIRGIYLAVWKKMQAGARPEPMEALIAAVIREHPEYHALLADRDAALERDYTQEHGEANPFLHMGMHLAIREQVRTDHPPGISALYHLGMEHGRDGHEIEHQMMECLGEALWRAQRDGATPDDDAYLECLRRCLMPR